jgi:hypothetical protein
MKNKIGRPTVITDEVLRKLEEVFALGGTDEEACFYADISTTTLYEYQKGNEEFSERKNRLKQKPFLKARQSIIKGLDDSEFALKYMERKKKDEFSTRFEHTGKDGEPITELEVKIIHSNNEVTNTGDTSSGEVNTENTEQ